MPTEMAAPGWLKRWPYWPVITHPQLRILLPGIGISSLGDGMSTVTISWLALKIAPDGQSALWLALAVAAYTLPGALGAVAFARWLGGRSGAQLACWDAALRAVMLMAIPLAFAVHLLTVGLYVALLAVSSLLSAWGKAGRYTLLHEVLPDEHLQAGNAIVNVLLEFSTVVGPSVAAVVIATAGAPWAIGIDAATFAVLALSYWFAVPPAAKEERIKPAASRSAGFRAIRQDRHLASLLLVSFGFFLFFGPVTVALPLHVVHDLHGKPGALAGYFTCFGIGAVTGAIASGHMKNWPALPTSIGTVIGVGLALLPIGLGAPTAVGWLAFGLVGLIWGPFPSTTTTLIQRRSRPGELPAVLAARGALTSVASPFGAMVGAPLAAAFGAQRTLLFSGSAIIAIGLCAAAYFTTHGADASPERRALSQAAVHDRLPESDG